MDERLEAGRHHLTNGDRALRDGYLDEGRSHFEAALLQFRGPELRLGEAHALRGMAHVELGCGNIALAEQTVRAAILAYQAVRDQLGHVDPHGVSDQLLRDAEEGEGAALVLLGDLLLRLGRGTEARETLSYAREIYRGLGDLPSAGGVWLALARLALRDGRYSHADEAITRCIQVHGKSGDRAGQSTALLVRAELERAGGDLEKAQATVDEALLHAEAARSPQVEGRAHSHRAAILLQRGQHDEAGEAWEQALVKIREGGDVEMEGFALIGLGEVQSKLGRAEATTTLAEAARVLGRLEHQHGLGAAMLQVSHHALRTHQVMLSLAAAESARQLWQRPDPVRGVGMALRLVVKALAGLKQWPAVLAASHLRAQIAGEMQPNAIAVRDFYRERANERVLDDLDRLTPEQLEARTEALLEAILTPILEPLDLDPFSLATPGGALALVEALIDAHTAVPAPVREADKPPGYDEGPAIDLPKSAGDFAGLYTAPTSVWDDPDDDFED